MSRELKPLREVMAQAVAAARLSQRTIEEALGLPSGHWLRVLSGQRTLRVRHLLGLARLLSVPPRDFLDLALPEAAQAADLRLADYFEPTRPRGATPQAAADLQSLIRDAVRRELEGLPAKVET